MYHNRTKLDNKTYLLFLWTHFYKKDLWTFLFAWSILVFIFLFIHLFEPYFIPIDITILTVVMLVYIFFSKLAHYLQFTKKDTKIIDYVFEKDALHLYIQVRNQTFEQIVPYFIIKEMITTKDLVILYTSRTKGYILNMVGFEEPFYLIKSFVQAELLLNQLK